MRIIGGFLRGRKLQVPVAKTTRPTTDFVREALFNILNHQFDFSSLSFLDLFAGTGAISFEMASRDCSQITLVENNFQCLKFIKTSIQNLKIDSINVVNADAYQYLKSTAEHYDLIFADPPYQDPNISKIPQYIAEKKLLRNNGLFILEHSYKNDFSDQPGFQQKRKYGNASLSFFQ